MTRDEIQALALEAIGDKRNAAVEVSMGVGKCVLGMKHMCRDYHDTAQFLVVAPRVDIFDSWRDDARDHGFQELMNWHITFSTYMSLDKQSLDYDVVYLDECHSLKETHEPWLKAFEEKGGKIIGLTGTYPVRKYTEKGKMCNRFCPRVYEYTTDYAIEDGILNDYRIYVHKMNLSSAPTIEVKMKSGKSFMTSELKSIHYWNRMLDEEDNPQKIHMLRIKRMKMLQNMQSKEDYAKKLFDSQQVKTLLFANTKEQADRLGEHTIYSGKAKENKITLAKFKSGEIQKVVAIDKLSEGVTVPGLMIGIIMHSYANERKAAQKIGRFLRLNPNQISAIHILCYMNSVDKDWVTSALKEFDPTKIMWIDPLF